MVGVHYVLLPGDGIFCRAKKVAAPDWRSYNNQVVAVFSDYRDNLFRKGLYVSVPGNVFSVGLVADFVDDVGAVCISACNHVKKFCRSVHVYKGIVVGKNVPVYNNVNAKLLSRFN